MGAECVVLAETKDHLDWDCSASAPGSSRATGAYGEIEDQEDEHESLGMKAVLPPLEERRHVTTAIGAARAEHSRKHH